MPDEDPRPAARAKLDDAIREYAGAMCAADEGIIGVGGWNVIVHAATSDEGTDKYLTVQTGVTYEQLRRAQARAEQAGLTGDALREVLAMICQPPRETYWSGNNRRVV